MKPECRPQRPVALVVAALLMAWLAGCVVFEEQAMSYRYDAAADVLRIFQEYRGISAEKQPVDDEERAQLESVLSGQRTFFFNNWITEFNRPALLETLAGVRDPERRRQSGVSEVEARRQERVLTNLLDTVRVVNGPFYLDGRGRLCGVQYVTVTGFSRLVAELNEYAPHFARGQAGERDQAAEDREALLRFADHPEPLVIVDGNALTIRYPMGATEYAKDFDAPTIERLRRGGVAVTLVGGFVEFRMGARADAITTITQSFKPGSYTNNLMDLARGRHPVRKEFDVRRAAEDFLKSGRATEAGKP